MKIDDVMLRWIISPAQGGFKIYLCVDDSCHKGEVVTWQSTLLEVVTVDTDKISDAISFIRDAKRALIAPLAEEDINK